MKDKLSHWTVLNTKNGMTYGGLCESRSEAQKANSRFWREAAFAQVGDLFKEKDALFMAPIFLPFMLAVSCKEYFSDLRDSQPIELKPHDKYRPWGAAQDFIHAVDDDGMPHVNFFGRNTVQQKT